MKITSSFFEYLRQKILVSDIVGSKVVLKKQGSEYGGLCPFHSEKTPSFTVSNKKRFYYCFGCGAGGDIMRFISETDGVSYSDAAIKIADQYGIEIPKLNKKEAEAYEEMGKLQDILALAGEFYKKHFNEASSKYLNNRKITNDIISEFEIGYAPNNHALQKFLESKNIPLILMKKAGLISKSENNYHSDIFRNRIIFPIKNIYNKIIAFGGRSLGDAHPKYINSPETILFNKSDTLYGENKATSAAYKKNRLILVEGYVDVISMHQSGFAETVAALGTAITEKHINRIWKICDEVIFLLDGDNAGLKAAAKAAKILLPILNKEKKASFILLPDKYDPHDYLQEYGNNSMKITIEKRMSLSEFLWEFELSNKPVTKAEDFIDLESKLNNHIQSINDKMIVKNFNNFFKDNLWKLRKQSQQTKFNNKSQLTLSADLKTEYNYTELEHIEYALISLILQMPILLKEPDILNEFENLEITLENIENTRNMILDNIEIIESNKENSTLIIKIKDLMKNTGFSDLYSLLSGVGLVFLDLQLSGQISSNNLWKLLIKKHHLALLKNEYNAALTSIDSKSFDRAMEYRKQIIVLEEENNKFFRSLRIIL